MYKYDITINDWHQSLSYVIAHKISLLITSEKVLWMGTGTRVKIQIIVTHATTNIVICM